GGSRFFRVCSCRFDLKPREIVVLSMAIMLSLGSLPVIVKICTVVAANPRDSRDCCRRLILQRRRRSGSLIVLSSFSRFVIGPNPSGCRSGAFAIPQDRQNRVKRCGALAHQTD